MFLCFMLLRALISFALAATHSGGADVCASKCKNVSRLTGMAVGSCEKGHAIARRARGGSSLF